MLGKAKQVRIDKENTTIIDGAGKKAGHPGPHRPDQGADRGDDQRLRQGEAAGAAGQARRRRRDHPRRRLDRGRDEGDEGPRRRRPARDRAAVEEGIVAGGGVALPARQGRDRQAQRRERRRPVGHQHRAAGRSKRRSGRSPRIPASKVRSSSARFSRTSRRPSASTPRPSNMSTCSRPASSIRPRWCASPCRTRLRSPACMITTEAMVADRPEGRRSGDAGRRRHGRHGRNGLLIAR